jgi:hypothetical protein
MPCPYRFKTYAMAKQFQSIVQGGRLKAATTGFDSNHDSWRSEDRRYKFNTFSATARCLDFSSHAADYVVYRDVADGVVGAVYYG